MRFFSNTTLENQVCRPKSGINLYPFGSTMTGRTSNPEKYRYGFNGEEKDSEIKGEGNSVDFGERMYDPRLGRFLSIDKLTGKFPFYSPYQFAGNKPIVAIDLDGLEDYWVHTKLYSDGSKSEISVMRGDAIYEDFKKEMISKLGVAPVDDGVIMTTSQFSNNDQVESIAINYSMPSVEISENRYSLTDRIGKSVNNFALFKSGNSYGSMEGSDNGSLKGRKGFLKTAELMDGAGKSLESVAPFGKKTPIIGTVGGILSGTAEIMRTMDDLKQKGSKVAFKNGLIRGAEFAFGKAVDALPATGQEGLDAASKLMLKGGADAIKDEKTQENK
jgi:RHS repeat-associated protein